MEGLHVRGEGRYLSITVTAFFHSADACDWLFVCARCNICARCKMRRQGVLLTRSRVLCSGALCSASALYVESASESGEWRGKRETRLERLFATYLGRGSGSLVSWVRQAQRTRSGQGELAPLASRSTVASVSTFEHLGANGQCRRRMPWCEQGTAEWQCFKHCL